MNKINLMVFLAIAFIVFSFASVPTILAHSDETLLEAEHLVEEQISCDELTNTQLAAIGDYYMEQMHPGEEHEYMDEMMGGEGSESLEAMHINMAYRFYCDGSYENSEYGIAANNMPMMNNYFSNSSYMGFQWMPLSVAIILVLLVVLVALQVKKKSKGSKK